MDWLLFEQLDRLRGLQASMLEAVGLRPSETPYRVVYTGIGFALRSYGTGNEGGPLVGRRAHAHLWPQIVAWMARTWTH